MRYEFLCEICGYKEILTMNSSQRNNIQKCPKCQNKLTRLIGCPGFVFKGTGFYTTDVLHKKTHSKQAKKEKKLREEGKSCWREY